MSSKKEISPMDYIEAFQEWTFICSRNNTNLKYEMITKLGWTEMEYIKGIKYYMDYLYQKLNKDIV